MKNNAAVSSLNKGAFLAETSAVSLTATSQAESSLSETSQAESSLSETSQAASVQDDSSVSAQASGDVVDLTKLNGTMMYSQVFDMMSNPQKYMGKRVVMRGQFSFYQPMDGDGKPIPIEFIVPVSLQMPRLVARRDWSLILPINLLP